jgi:hypothetical protein
VYDATGVKNVVVSVQLTVIDPLLVVIVPHTGLLGALRVTAVEGEEAVKPSELTAATLYL